MPIIAKGKEFEVCPAGLHHAKIADITQFTHENWGERVKFTFETDQIGKEGQNLSVFHEASLHLSPKAKLSGIVESILGRSVTPEERKNGFNVEKLLGKKCQVNVKHRFSQTGNEYAYVDAIITNGNHQEQPTPATVEEDNEADVNDEFAEANAELQEAAEDDIPF
jgi:hypothetical protein